MRAVCSFLRSYLLWELQLWYKVTWRDIPAAFVTGCAFTLVAAKHHGYPLIDSVTLVPWTLFYFCFNLYSFKTCAIKLQGLRKTELTNRTDPSPVDCSQYKEQSIVGVLPQHSTFLLALLLEMCGIHSCGYLSH